jgi:hypothetical protein
MHRSKKQRLKKKKRTKQRRANNFRNAPSASVRSATFVRDINLRPPQSRFLRYDVSGTDSVTRQFMLDSILAVNGTAAHRIFESVRLIHVRCYLMANQANDEPTLSLTWDGDRGPDVKYNTEAATGIPGEIYSRPPEGTLAGYWSTDGVDESENLFTVEVNANATCYMDIYFEYVLADGVATTATATASKTAGIYVFRSGGLRPIDLEEVQLV